MRRIIRVVYRNWLVKKSGRRLKVNWLYDDDNDSAAADDDDENYDNYADRDDDADGAGDVGGNDDDGVAAPETDRPHQATMICVIWRATLASLALIRQRNPNW